MHPGSSSPDPALGGRSPGDLLEDMRWLRGLAVALVGSSSADDVVQESFEVALRSEQPVRDIRPFLAGVARSRID